jgi:hypothetical protein
MLVRSLYPTVVFEDLYEEAAEQPMQRNISTQEAVKPALADAKGPMSMASASLLKCHDTYTFNERISHPSHRAVERGAESAWFTERDL